MKQNEQQVKNGRSLRAVQQFFPEVTTVVDATEPLDIEVSKTDVKNVNRRKHDKCVLAEVCRRGKDVDGVVVALKTVYIVKDRIATRYKQGESATREIISFDRSGVFEPGNYHLRPPAATERLGYDGSNGKTRTKKFKRTGFRHMTAGVRRLAV